MYMRFVSSNNQVPSFSGSNATSFCTNRVENFKGRHRAVFRFGSETECLLIPRRRMINAAIASFLYSHFQSLDRITTAASPDSQTVNKNIVLPSLIINTNSMLQSPQKRMLHFQNCKIRNLGIDILTSAIAWYQQSAIFLCMR